MCGVAEPDTGSKEVPGAGNAPIGNQARSHVVWAV